MHLSNKQRLMNKTYTILANKYCLNEQDEINDILENINQLPTTLDNNRFCTFTKCKIKDEPIKGLVNQPEEKKRYFDSPTMITLDDDDDNDIPISRCSNKPSATTTAAVEPSLNETDLSDLLIFTNPNRILNESMQVVVSRHPSLQDLKYINDVSSVLIGPPITISSNREEPIYQELIQSDHLILTPPIDPMNDIDENKENRPPLMPVKCPTSRIPVWTPSPTNKNINTPGTTSKTKKQEETKNKKTITTTIKPCLTDLLDEWSLMTPKLKELLTNTRKLPLRVPQLTTNSNEFRRLKQLLNDMEVTTSSWTNAINQCRYILRHAQQQLNR